MLKGRGAIVGVQNYIDNTGVQVADVVVGLAYLPQDTFSTVTEQELRTAQGVKKMIDELAVRAKANPADRHNLIDYYCWNLYARVSDWYAGIGDNAFEIDEKLRAERKQIRLDTLHALETGGNETAQIAELISTAVLRRHLETMQRLGIEYDFLPRESEILSLHFWDAARTLMLDRGVLYMETEGKNKGCW